MERRGRLFAYLGYPVITRLARMLASLVDVTDFRLSRNGAARIEPVDAATWVRVGLRLCALEYRFERQAKCGKEMRLPSGGYRRMSSAHESRDLTS